MILTVLSFCHICILITLSLQFLCFSLAEDGQEKPNEDAPENNPQYTTVYVGNLAPEARIFLFFIFLKLIH